MKIRSTILFIWRLIDPIFYFCSRLQYIYTEEKKRTIFRVRLTRYKGKNVILSDGTYIQKNDLLLKIHLHNVRLLSELININNDLIKARIIYKRVLTSLPALAHYLKNHPNQAEIKGIIGITTIYKSASWLGFEKREPYSRVYGRIKKYGQMPIFLLSNPSFENFRKLKLIYLLMSKEELINRYYMEP